MLIILLPHYYILQMMFFASIIIASFGAAGILSAIAAARPSYEIERIAVGYLIATSVS